MTNGNGRLRRVSGGVCSRPCRIFSSWAGPNGAGKTTYARRFLPQEMRCHEFVNADLIAAGLSPFRPADAEVEAGRIMVQRLKLLRTERKDFSFETTLSSYGYVTMLEEMRAAGYRIRLDFLWVRELETSRLRVRSRVVKGGHNIPDDVQQRRFGKGIRLLLEHYRPLIHYWRFSTTRGRSRGWWWRKRTACCGWWTR